METGRPNGYSPIKDYAIIGDGHTAALVSSDGSIDWCCWPRFDSPALFCRLLDAKKGGSFRVGPVSGRAIHREYLPGTNILSTTFEADSGSVRLIDFMPVERLTESHRGEDIAPSYRMIRLVEGLAGNVEIEVYLRATFDFALSATEATPTDFGGVARHGNEAVVLGCPCRLSTNDQNALTGSFRIRPGERIWIELDYIPSFVGKDEKPMDGDFEQQFDQARSYWLEWWNTCRYNGDYLELVRRSALTLKLLTYEPTGALIAAPTTSLPEEIGGVRNWDYRYTWLRDSSLILYALQLLGYYEEASDFFEWLNVLCLPCIGKLQTMYTIDGKSDLSEKTLGHLEGHRGSRPVRVGNAAFSQTQLDVCGEVLDAVHLFHHSRNLPVKDDWWDEISFLAGEIDRRWKEPDSGIWEVRGECRQYLYSKLLCWVGLDRAVKLADSSGRQDETAGWRKSCSEIRNTILKHGYNDKVGAFTQSLDGNALDASALIIPLTGFLPATDPRVKSTVARIQERLTFNGLVYRYLNDDGLPGDEATFVLSTFWLVDNLALQGRVDEARELFERVTGYANDVGLLAEEIDPSTGEQLGNFPQGFSHLALIRSALNITKAEAGGAEIEAETMAERIVKTDRLEKRAGVLKS